MATPRAPGDDGPVTAIGRYQFVSAMAPGALGELWKARIVSGPEQGRIVAIRRVPRTGAFDAKSVERLTNTGFAAMEVRHPKIAAVLDVVVADTEIALVSEHIGGTILHNLLRPPDGKRPNVSPEVGARIVLDVLEALEALRSQWRDLFPSLESDDDRLLASAAHGGLVPDSILVASFGEAMLLDAGLAGIAMTMHPILDHAEVIAYRAPEQLERTGPVDERADLFSAAVILWELLAGRPLFAPAALPRAAATGPAVKTKAFSDAMQVSTVRRKVLTSPIQRLDTLPLLRGRVTKAYADIVARCLERDPAKRFGSIAEVVEQFAALGPKSVAGHDAVSRLLSSVSIAPPRDETPVEHVSGRSTSNRPTVPPEKGGARDSAPPDTRRTAVPSEATTERNAVAAPQRAKAATLPKPRVDTPIEDGSLTFEDVQSIPPTAAVESVLPASTDVESLPPSGDGRATLPVDLASSEMSSMDVESLPPSAPARIEKTAERDIAPFTPALAPPVGATPSPVEETTSAPVVRAVGSDDAPDLPSTLMSPHSGGAKYRKVVIGVVAAAGVVALVALLRVALSGHANEEPSSASAASSATPSPPATEPAAVEPSSSSAPAEAPPPGQTAAAPVPQSPTSVPASPVSGSQAAPALQPKRREPANQQPANPQPAKKKPFRPNAI